jgi:hypothetical protein
MNKIQYSIGLLLAVIFAYVISVQIKAEREQLKPVMNHSSSKQDRLQSAKNELTPIVFGATVRTLEPFYLSNWPFLKTDFETGE